MIKRFFAVILLTLIATPLLAQTTVQELSVSKQFASVPGTPRVVRNSFQHVWAVAWRQQGSPAKIIGRLITSDGKLRPKKTLAKGVSSTANGFDIFYDSVNYTYLLAFENAKGLNVQPLKGTLAKNGPGTLIAPGLSGSNPRFAFNAENQTFLLFWLESQGAVSGKVLKGQLLDTKGKPLADANVIAQATGSSAFQSLSISTNQKSGKLVAILLLADGTKGRLVGYNIDTDASLLRKKALNFQTTTEGLVTTGDASFADNGKGLGFWSDRGAIRYRKMSVKGGFSSASKQIPNAGDATSLQTSILNDSRNNTFIGIWGAQSEVRGVVFNATGAINKAPFAVVQGGPDVIFSNVATSYDSQLGNVVVVYDEATGTGGDARYRVKATVFFIQSNTTQKGISIGDNFFTGPNGNGNITVQAGDTVTWTNNGVNPHTVTSGSEGNNAGAVFDSGNLNRGAVFSFRFTSVGQFPYFCRVHGGGVMTGVVTVQQSDGEGGPRY